MPPGPSAITAAATEAADAAGRILRRYFRTSIQPDTKSDHSPVTIADREAETALRTAIARHFPAHAILGEEQGGSQGEYTWVLDPIDGTRAFITGRPSFVTLIALLHDGAPVLGLIDQPITGERWLGLAGQPTQFLGPHKGQPQTRPCAALAEAELSATSPDMFGDQTPRWRRLADRTRRTSWGGDGYAYGLLALGQIDVIAECDLKLWDWAALVPVVEGAGGRMVDWNGDRLAPGSDGRVLAVGDPRLLGPALQALR